MKSKTTLIRKITSIALAAVCVIGAGYVTGTAFEGATPTVSAAQEPLQNRFGAITPRNSKGETVIKFSARGGTGNYTYDVEIAREGSSDFKKVNSKRITTESYAFKIDSKSGCFQIRTTVYDGKTSDRSYPIRIWLTDPNPQPITNTSALDLEKCGSTCYKLNGKPYVYVKCSATGGSGKYNYKVEFKNSKIGGWNKVVTYNDKKTKTVKFQISDYTYNLKPGTTETLVKTNIKKGNDYLIRVTVTDANGDPVAKSKVLMCTTKP